jgi:hypothetical protein
MHVSICIHIRVQVIEVLAFEFGAPSHLNHADDVTGEFLSETREPEDALLEDHKGGVHNTDVLMMSTTQTCLWCLQHRRAYDVYNKDVLMMSTTQTCLWCPQHRRAYDVYNTDVLMMSTTQTCLWCLQHRRAYDVYNTDVLTSNNSDSSCDAARGTHELPCCVSTSSCAQD